MKKVLAIPDLHVPNQDRRALDAVEQYLETEGPWDEVIQLGDFFDFDQLSRWRKDEPAAQLARLRPDYDEGNRILDRWQSLTDASITILAGNHDARADQLSTRQPVLKGLVEVDVNLRLQERGIRYVRCYPDNDVYKVGKVAFTHGWHTGPSCAKKAVEQFGTSVVFGHTHTAQTFTMTRFGKHGTPIQGITPGCLCKLEPGYMGKRPSGWVHGIVTLWIGPRQWSSAVSVITSGTLISPTGVVYKGRRA